MTDPMTAPMDDSVQPVRHDWTLAEIKALFDLSFNDLLFQAQSTIAGISMPMRYRSVRC